MMFWTFGLAAQERAELDMGQLTARRAVRLVNDKRMTVGRLSPEKPGVLIRATIQFSPLRHESMLLLLCGA